MDGFTGGSGSGCRDLEADAVQAVHAHSVSAPPRGCRCPPGLRVLQHSLTVKALLQLNADNRRSAVDGALHASVRDQGHRPFGEAMLYTEKYSFRAFRPLETHPWNSCVRKSHFQCLWTLLLQGNVTRNKITRKTRACTRVTTAERPGARQTGSSGGEREPGGGG